MLVCLTVISLLLLSSCSGIKTYIYIDEPDRSIKYKLANKEPDVLIVQSTVGSMTAKVKDVEVTVDTRRPNVWERFVAPVIKKGIE